MTDRLTYTRYTHIMTYFPQAIFKNILSYAGYTDKERFDRFIMTFTDNVYVNHGDDEETHPRRFIKESKALYYTGQEDFSSVNPENPETPAQTFATEDYFPNVGSNSVKRKMSPQQRHDTYGTVGIDARSLLQNNYFSNEAYDDDEYDEELFIHTGLYYEPDEVIDAGMTFIEYYHTSQYSAYEEERLLLHKLEYLAEKADAERAEIEAKYEVKRLRIERIREGYEMTEMMLEDDRHFEKDFVNTLDLDVLFEETYAEFLKHIDDDL